MSTSNEDIFDIPSDDSDDEDTLNSTRNNSVNFGDLAKLKGITITHLNVCSLINKLDHVTAMFLKGDLDICLITETWLDDTINNTELQVPGHYLFRNDRDKSKCKQKGWNLCLYKE